MFQPTITRNNKGMDYTYAQRISWSLEEIWEEEKDTKVDWSVRKKLVPTGGRNKLACWYLQKNMDGLIVVTKAVT